MILLTEDPIEPRGVALAGRVEVVMPPSIQTRHAGVVNLLHPTPEMIDIGDIAAALSVVPRFAGHVGAYSVAEHSVHVMRLAGPDIAREALLHDASEAYLGDVSSPLKALLPDYQFLERRFQAVIATRYGLSEDPAVWARVKDADLRMLRAEAEYFGLMTNAPHWDWVRTNIEPSPEWRPWNPAPQGYVRYTFLAEFVRCFQP